ncbi:hypothetical protein [Bradyrhizobium sp. CCGUVB23]|uniref:capsid assembly protein n=1 Tax=Bradyrhizobium sp. CCGUVB23 TaxID=2949630 RepID=UPI0020B25929|nr:hypothetical protein [Bradyrhizobium sp. CCGUVB23]MCP3460716.1 hypothetical protein [Bradyrhizobium sp. CCGUVB23]
MPEQFATAEDMAKAYADLERAQTSGHGSQATPQRASPAHSGDVPANHSDAAMLVESAGLDFNTEYAQKGTLSAKSYADLARAGIDRAIVDGYIAGQQAIAQDMKSAVFDAAGGADAYTDLTGWAAVIL